jgi:hypothetical protein
MPGPRGVLNRLRTSIRNGLSRNRNTRRNISPSVQNLTLSRDDNSLEGRVNDDGTISVPDRDNEDTFYTYMADRDGNPLYQVTVVNGEIFPYHPEAHTFTKTASEIPMDIHKLGRRVKIYYDDSPEKSNIPTAVGVGVYNPSDIGIGDASIPIPLTGKKRRKKTQKKRRSRKSKKRNKNKKR